MSVDPNDPRVIEGLRKRTPAELTRFAVDLYRMALDLNEAGIRDRHPDWDGTQVIEEIRRCCRISGVPYIDPSITDEASIRSMAEIGFTWDPRLRPENYRPTTQKIATSPLWTFS